MLKFLQNIGKSLMLPIAVLPVAAILLRIGQPDLLDMPFISSSGDALFANLPLLFAIGVANGLSDDQNGAAALTGAIAYLVLDFATKAYWTQSLGAEATETLKMSFFGGLIAGTIAALSYNRFKSVKLPEWLGFFGGRRFVPIITSLIMIVVAIVAGEVWPYIQDILDGVARRLVSLGAIGSAIYGFFNRLLIPFGLHHVFNSYFWFALGEFTGPNGVVTGDLNRFFAGDPTAGIYMAGFFPVMMFGLPGIALAIYLAAKKEKRKVVGGMLISLALTTLVTGITEPLEFSFIFLSPVLLVAHALLTALSMFITNSLGVLHGFGFSAGLIDYILNYNLATNPWRIVPIGLCIGIIYFFVFYILIVKLNLPTPGREEDDEVTVNHKIKADDEALAISYIEALGGKENIVKIDNCATRLRLEVVDSAKVNEKILKSLGARGVVKLNKTNVQIVVGSNVEFVSEGIKKIIK